MGRLPSQFAGRNITFRVPYQMAGELTLGFSSSGTQYPDAVFSHQIDKPFEIHRVIPRITALDGSGLVLATQPTQDTLTELVRLFIFDFSKNEAMMKSPTLVSLITKGSSERTWEWAEPYTIVRSEGFQVRVDTLAIPNPNFNPAVTSLRMELSFQGFLLVVAPPSENR